MLDFKSLRALFRYGYWKQGIMDDEQWGRRDKRGDWHPKELVAYPPAPWHLVQFARWLLGLPGYLFPWTLAYIALSALLWRIATPAVADMQTLSWQAVAAVLARNLAVVIVVYGAWHYFLYIKKTQGQRFKLNGRWPAVGNDTFLFKRQTLDNMVWSLASGVPIWTAWEVFCYWVFANHYVVWVSFADQPILFVAVLLAVPVFHDLHFYLIHRLLHWPPLYRTVHYLHHNAVNVTAWSGLSMHPVEHLLYFSGVLIHFVVPSSPFHVLFHLLVVGLGAARGHTGFDRLVLGETASLPMHTHMHYLHHKYFECNYGDGPLPLDKWAGTFHDGSPDAQQRMTERFKARAQRMGMATK